MDVISKLLGIKNNQEINRSIQDNENMEINSAEVNIEKIEQDLMDWTLPKQDIKTIYSIGTFKFLQDYSIKTTEQTITLNQEEEHIQLFSDHALREHRRNKFKFLHIGSVQIAIKPLFRLGLDIPVLMVLRDARHRNFRNQLLAMAETNLANGPVYFNCYPNFSISLFDSNILDTLTLSIKTKNLDIKENVRSIAIIYRIQYKVMTTTLQPKSKKNFTKNETILFEANKNHSRVEVPKRLKWNEVTESGKWNLKEIVEPKPLEINTKLTSIIESDGDVELNFSKLESVSTRFSSFTEPSTSFQKLPEMVRSKSTGDFDLQGVDFKNSIPRPFYTEEIKSNKTPSPTKSQMNMF